MIQVKRVYDEAESADGTRFLVDRLWPRGVKKSSLRIRARLRDAAPTNELRSWYHHDPTRWDEFRNRYFSELRENPVSWFPLLEAARHGTVTLLYSSHHAEHNNAQALKQFLIERLHAD